MNETLLEKAPVALPPVLPTTPVLPTVDNTASVDNSAIEAPADEPKAPSVFERAICVAVDIRRLGTKRKVDKARIRRRSADGTESIEDALKIGPASITTDADPALLAISKEILASKELKAIERYDGELRRYLQSQCLPSQFKAGIYLLPNELIVGVDAELRVRTGVRQQLVEAFLATYEQRKQEAEAKLGSLFNERDYPAIETVRWAFSLSFKYVAFETPKRLREIKREIFERESEKAAAEWQNALEECRTVLRATLAEIVDHMADRLTPSDDGKPKTFRDSMVQKLDDFLGSFTARNIADDAQLDAVVRQARAVMSGVTAKDLRKNEAIREAVAGQMVEIKKQLDEMVIDRPGRKITFDEE